MIVMKYADPMVERRQCDFVIHFWILELNSKIILPVLPY